MKYRFKSLKQILDLFNSQESLWVTEIALKLGKSNVIVHKYLKELVLQNKLERISNWPKTKYKLTFQNQNILNNNLDWLNIQNYSPDYKTQKILQEIFFKFSPEWNILKWFDGIKSWCTERWFDIEAKVKNYISIYNYIQTLEDSCWLLDASWVFWKHFENIYLDKVYYADQYKRMEFWRWKLAEMTFYAKQSQNKELIMQSIEEIDFKLKCIIRKEKFDAIAIVPWSIDRKNQLLHFLKNDLKDLKLPFINIIKYYPNNIAIPQKSLKTREQRLHNALNTIFIDDENIKKYSKVLLIDDFVWSGSTLNETAKKIKQEWIKEVFWFAFVWNLNLEYEIINEV